MANLTVSVVIRVKDEDGKWRRLPIVRSANGRIRRGFGMVDGDAKKFDAYTYQLRTYEGLLPKYESIGTDALEASNRQATKEKNRLLRHEAKLAGVAVAEDGDRRTIKKAADEFVARAAKKRKDVAAQCYRTSLDAFLQSATKIMYLDQVDEATMLDFHDFLRRRGNSERTIANRHGHVKALLLWCGYHREDLKKKLGDPPTYDKKIPVVYKRDDLSTLFASIEDDRYLYTVLKLLNMSGLREAEATHLMWADIDFKAAEIHVSAKPELGFRLKDREERIVPLPAELVEVLRERRKVVPRDHRLVVGTADDQPHTKWLRLLKRAVRKADLNCGRCRSCREAITGLDAGCQRWTLHGFRRTFATMLDEAGFSLRQIMDYLGHADIATTMKYLGNRREKTMESVKW